MATVMVVAPIAVIVPRKLLICVIPATPEKYTDSPTRKVCEPTVATADAALVIAVMLRDLSAANVTRPVVVLTVQLTTGVLRISNAPMATLTVPDTGLNNVR